MIGLLQRLMSFPTSVERKRETTYRRYVEDIVEGWVCGINDDRSVGSNMLVYQEQAAYVLRSEHPKYEHRDVKLPMHHTNFFRAFITVPAHNPQPSLNIVERERLSQPSTCETHTTQVSETTRTPSTSIIAMPTSSTTGSWAYMFSDESTSPAYNPPTANTSLNKSAATISNTFPTTSAIKIKLVIVDKTAKAKQIEEMVHRDYWVGMWTREAVQNWTETIPMVTVKRIVLKVKKEVKKATLRPASKLLPTSPAKGRVSRSKSKKPTFSTILTIPSRTIPLHLKMNNRCGSHNLGRIQIHFDHTNQIAHRPRIQTADPSILRYLSGSKQSSGGEMYQCKNFSMVVAKVFLGISFIFNEYEQLVSGCTINDAWL
ncbi:hypothetical protein B7494_g2194 [Chlorociboria aeruginascens]|nr:hypothetical protein B7494_g2194 [Chlorociboria aeruginascens]